MDFEVHIEQHRRCAIRGIDIAKLDNWDFIGRGFRFRRRLEATNRPERFRVVFFRGREHLAGLGLFNRFAEFEDLNTVRHLRHHREVVGDVNRRRAELLNRIADRREHFDLRGDVEGRGRFVKDNQIRAAGHGHRRHRPLKLSARYLVWIAETDLVRIGQLQPTIKFRRVARCLRIRHDTVLNWRFGILIDQLVGGVKARRSRLSDISDFLAAQLTAIGLARFHEVRAFELHRAARNSTAAARVAHGGQTDGRLARAGLANHAEDFAAFEVEVDALENGQPIVAGLAVDFQIADLEDGIIRHRLLSFHTAAGSAGSSGSWSICPCPAQSSGRSLLQSLHRSD